MVGQRKRRQQHWDVILKLDHSPARWQQGISGLSEHWSLLACYNMAITKDFTCGDLEQITCRRDAVASVISLAFVTNGGNSNYQDWEIYLVLEWYWYTEERKWQAQFSQLATSGKCENQKAPRATFMERLLSYTHRTDHTEDQAWNLIVRVENFW